MVGILEKVREWFEGGKAEDHVPLPNQGQMRYESQTAPVDVQAQEVPIELQTIPVAIDGIVPTWDLPTKFQVFKTSAIVGNTPSLLIDGNYKLKRITIHSLYTGFYIGTETQVKSQSANGPDGFLLPTDRNTVISGLNEDLWFIQSAISVEQNQPQPIYYIAEYWAN